MARKRAVTTRVSRSAKTGKFIPVKDAKRRKSTTVVQTVKRKGQPNKQASTTVSSGN